MPGLWEIDELAHAGPEHLDPAFVAGFDRKQGYPDPAADLALLRDHGIGPSSTVVDLGAGTGRFALAAVRAGIGRVIAVDISPAMIGHLRARATESGATGRLECVRAGFLSYEHEGPAADAVHTRHALHQLPDFWKGVALDRIARILRPGGILRLRDLVYDFRPAQARTVLDSWLAGAARDPADGYTAEDYAEHVRTEHSTYRFLLEPLLEASGFEIADVSFEGSLYGAYTCVRRG
ncbi:methyltransferase domain-containing protein [Streptomyces sp. GC420]|nr:methyltransferase domain-containing protein [Streptomyces sp. GC420]